MFYWMSSPMIQLHCHLSRSLSLSLLISLVHITAAAITFGVNLRSPVTQRLRRTLPARSVSQERRRRTNRGWGGGTSWNYPTRRGRQEEARCSSLLSGPGLVIFLEGGPWTVLTGEPEAIWKRFKTLGPPYPCHNWNRSR